MSNYLVIILLVAIAFGLTDFLTERFPRLQRDISYISFAVIAFLCTIKYFYGPDVANYYPFYQNVQPASYLLAHPDDIRFHFELGYALFCSVLRHWGVSFYWMTAIISVFYFLVIALLFRQIESKRSFALAILMVLDYNIILFEFRQCLSVAAFLLMILCMSNRKYVWALLCAVVTVMCHKAGVMVVFPTLIFYIISYNSTVRAIFPILLVALIFMLVLPITSISINFLSHLPFSQTMISSIEHHLMIGKQVQSVFIIYAIVLLCLVHYAQYCQSRMEIIATSALIGIFFIVMLYQYYYLLNRIRSYFTPVILVYIFNYVQRAEREKHIPYGQLLKQLTSFVMMVYMVHVTFSLYRNESRMRNHVNETCTVFSLLGDESKEEVQRRQLKRAHRYWDEDFMKSDENLIKR